MEDIQIGTGPSPSPGDTLTVHYTLTIDGFDGKTIDSSRDRNHPFSYRFDKGQVIKGWDLGIASMKVGGRRRLVIPPEFGYGARGAGNVIPPNTTLYFDIQFIKVN